MYAGFCFHQLPWLIQLTGCSQRWFTHGLCHSKTFNLGPQEQLSFMRSSRNLDKMSDVRVNEVLKARSWSEILKRMRPLLLTLS